MKAHTQKNTFRGIFNQIPLHTTLMLLLLSSLLCSRMMLPLLFSLISSSRPRMLWQLQNRIEWSGKRIEMGNKDIYTVIFDWMLQKMLANIYENHIVINIFRCRRMWMRMQWQKARNGWGVQVVKDKFMTIAGVWMVMFVGEYHGIMIDKSHATHSLIHAYKPRP